MYTFWAGQGESARADGKGGTLKRGTYLRNGEKLTRLECPHCMYPIRLRKDGTIRAHGKVFTDNRIWEVVRCKGTGMQPVQLSTSLPNMKKSSNKQRVLFQFPKAACTEVTPGLFQVDLGNGTLSPIGGSPSSAWRNAAVEVGAKNAVDTNSPFVL